MGTNKPSIEGMEIHVQYPSNGRENFQILLTLLLLHLPLGLPQLLDILSPPRVTINDGRLTGKYIKSRGGRRLAAFLGVPFAKPPVGNLRFQAPEPTEPWDHERLATSHASSCIQIQDPTGSEDCLYLDVYTHDTSSQPLLPVIAYIYGGCFEIGSSDGYTPDYLMDHDIVYVALQYRVALFGFLSTGDEVVPGNMGFKDQRLALRWVRDNIRYFGGDPEKVTIFGESAGAVSVHYHMMFSANEGLFRAAVSHSGSALVPWGFRPPVEVERMVDLLSTTTGCPSDSKGFVECLGAMPALEILLLYDVIYKQLMYVGAEAIALQIDPLVGGVLEPECVEDRFISDNPWGHNTTIPWLTGVNSKEALILALVMIYDVTNTAFQLMDDFFDLLFPKAMNYQSSNASGEQICSEIRNFYLDQKPISREVLGPFVDAASDALFIYGTYESVLRSDMDRTYLYVFDHIGANFLFPVPPSDRIGVMHLEELILFFPNPGNLVPLRLFDTTADRKMSEELITMWVNFATHLDPTPEGSCEFKWPPYSFNQSFLHIKQDTLEVEREFFPERMAFWKSQPFPFRDDTYV